MTTKTQIEKSKEAPKLGADQDEKRFERELKMTATARLLEAQKHKAHKAKKK